MIPYHRIARQFFNSPLLLTPQAAETISAFLLSRMTSARAGAGGGNESAQAVEAFEPQRRDDGSFVFHSARASRFYADTPLDDRGAPLPFARTPDGTAVISLVGEFVNRGAYVGASSGLISYEGFKFQLDRAVADPKTNAIVLDLESPGGQAAGAFEAAAAVRQAREAKPVIAVVNALAASAAYAIASNASRIVTMPSGMLGSIGVLSLHLDYSKMLDEEGIKPTLIFAGDHKVDGNSFEPLPESVRADWQREINSIYEQFVTTVAEGRGRKLSKKAIRETQAQTFTGQEAVNLGLADAVGTFESVLAELRGAAGTAKSPQRKGYRMTQSAGAPGAEDPGTVEASASSTTPTTVADLRAAFPELCAELVTEGEKAGAEKERARLASIDAAAMPGFEKIVADHKADPSKSAGDTALAIVAAQKAKGSAHLEGLKADETKVADIASSSLPAGKPAEDTRLVVSKAQAYKAEQEKAGHTISTAAAVAHVRKELGLQ